MSDMVHFVFDVIGKKIEKTLEKSPKKKYETVPSETVIESKPTEIDPSTEKKANK